SENIENNSKTKIHNHSSTNAQPTSYPIGNRLNSSCYCFSWNGNNCRSRKSDSKSLRSEEHTSELQSRFDLVCRLLLEKKKKKFSIHTIEHILCNTSYYLYTSNE